jgi:hypothetical protein
MKALLHVASGGWLLLAMGVAQADVPSGPAAGTELASFKVMAVAGAVSGEEKDFTAERKEKPTIYVFVQADKFDRPIGRFLKVLDQELAKDRNDVQVIAVWLTDDVEKSKEYLPRAQMSIQLEQTVWSVFGGERSGPANWNVDSAVNVTVVVADGAKAKWSSGYNSINDTVVPDVMKQLPAKK